MFIWPRTGGVLKIDTLKNLYFLNSANDTAYQSLVYKLTADTGAVWLIQKTPWDSIFAKVVSIFPGLVFGRQATIKKIEYTRYFEFGSFWLGNKYKYLATGFGLVQEDIEPSDVYVLAGAIINGMKYGTVVSIAEEPAFPEAFDILTNYPNPFNGSTVISYSISSHSHVNITIYDVLGRTLKTLVDERKMKGDFQIHFEATGMTSGLYFAVMRTKTTTLIHKMLYLK